MFDQYAPFIIASYAAFVAIIGGLGLYLVIDQRLQKRALAELETRQPKRSSRR
ncbi:MAG: ABC-type heme export system membrane stabilizing component CcmD [Saliniramus fredricksonii]|uniref:Heme exporter protein D n=1 Tax=Saliniramus fredricksonii TaxID=1653334 RepID=A0A0P7XPG0_9HYPH|nr:heme exporter protein CcmD [Saliniramus fredricksonii]KPQ09385.1 MAG: ABC-type heme export system membrane stabilizing component CcmD [Saliniramus fredricksonii]SCC80925.1 heme exporter protein CcmD [Saliniramus fredricksonii]